MAGIPNKTIFIIYSDDSYEEVQTNNEGTFSKAIDYELEKAGQGKAIFNGDETYITSMAYFNFNDGTESSNFTELQTTIAYNNINISVQLIDSDNGVPIPNGKCNITFPSSSNRITNIYTDNNGILNVMLPDKLIYHNTSENYVVITFEGSDEHLSTTLNINLKTTNIIYGDVEYNSDNNNYIISGTLTVDNRKIPIITINNMFNVDNNLVVEGYVESYNESYQNDFINNSTISASIEDLNDVFTFLPDNDGYFLFELPVTLPLNKKISFTVDNTIKYKENKFEFLMEN